jgi:hypothetical protein
MTIACVPTAAFLLPAASNSPLQQTASADPPSHSRLSAREGLESVARRETEFGIDRRRTPLLAWACRAARRDSPSLRMSVP